MSFMLALPKISLHGAGAIGGYGSYGVRKTVG